MLICDFAETYGILDYRALSPFTAATLAYGLRDDARIRVRASGMEASFHDVLLARAVDELAMIRWLNTVDGMHGTNRPAPLTISLLGKAGKPAPTKYGRQTPEEFMEAYYGE